MGNVLRQSILLLLLGVLLGGANAPAFAHPQPVAVVAMRFEGGVVLVDHVRVNGHGDYTFQLDTGATSCTVTPEVARALHLKRDGYSIVSAIGATRKLPRVKVESLSLGGATVHNPLTLIAGDNTLSDHVGHAVHGVLGTSFLWNWPVQFDYPGKQLIIYPESYDLRTEPVEDPWSGVGTLSLRDRAAYIKVSLNGSTPRDMMLDTGSTGLVISEARAREAKAVKTDWKSSFSGLLSPWRDSTFWLVDSVRVAGLTVRNTEALTPHDAGDWKGDQLGNVVLSQFRLTVDTARRIVRFERDAMPEWFGVFPFGVGVIVRRDMDAIRIAKVWPDSDAAAKGITTGDRLLRVGSSAAEETSDEDLQDLLSPAPGKSVTVEVSSEDGPARSLELRSGWYMRRKAAADGTVFTSLAVDPAKPPTQAH